MVLFIEDNLWVKLLSLGFAPDVRSASGLELENTGVNALPKTHLKLVLFSLWRASGSVTGSRCNCRSPVPVLLLVLL